MALFPDPSAVEAEELPVIFPSQEEPNQSPAESQDYITNTALVAAAAEPGALYPDQINNFNQQLDLMQSMIEKGYEDTIRAKHTEQERQDFLAWANEFQASIIAESGSAEEVAKSVVHLNNAMALKEAEVNKRAMENRAAANVVAMGAADPDLATILLYNAEHGETLDQLNEMVTKRMIISTELEKQNQLVEDRAGPNFIRNFWDMVTQAEEFGSGQVGLVETGATTLPFNIGRRKLEERNVLLSLPLNRFLEEAPKFFNEAKGQAGIFFDNDLEYLNTLQSLQEMTSSDVGWVNTFTALDAGLSMTALQGLRMAGGLKTILTRAGNTPMVANQMVNTLRGNLTNPIAKQAGKEAINEATGTAIPGAQTPTTGVVSPTLAEHIQERLAAQDEVVKVAKDLQQQGLERLSVEEKNKAVENELERLKLQHPKNPIKNYVVDEATQADEPITLKIWLGSRSGKGYATEKAAKNAAGRMGLTEYTLERGANETEWFITKTSAVDETGVVAVRELDEMAKVGTGRWFMAGNRNTLGEQLYGRTLWATLQNSGFYERVFKPFERDLRGFSKARRDALSAVRVVGEQEGKWYNADEFVAEYSRVNGVAPAQEDFVAYEAMRKVTDIEHFVRNRIERLNMAIRGIKSIKLNPELAQDLASPMGRELLTEKEIAQVPAAELRIYDISAGETYHPGTKTVADLKKMVESQGYRLVKLEKPTRFANTGGDALYIIGKKSDIKIGELPQQVLAYRAGGHREYAASYFIKQTRVGAYIDGAMEKFVRAPGVWVAGRSKVELQAMAKDMQAVVGKYKELLAGKISISDFEIALKESVWENIDHAEFKRMVDDGEIDLEHPFEVVFDRESPQSTTDLLKGGYKDLGASEAHAATDYYDTVGRMYYSKKGAPLLGPDGQTAELLDPFKTTANALANVNRLGAMNNYKLSEVARWVKSAEKYFEPGQKAMTSDMDKFLNGKLRPITVRESSAKEIETLEQYRNKLKRILGQKSNAQHLMEAKIRRLAESFDAKGMAKLRDWTFNLQDANPVRAMKALNFDLKLGFFSPAQLFVQAQTSFAALSIHPILGAEAMRRGPFVHAALINGSDNVLDYMATKFKALHGMEPAEFKQMVKSMRDSGFNQPGSELQLYNNFSNSIGDGWALSTVKSIREHGRFFVMEAERWNRIVGWSIGWELAKKEGKDLAKQETLQSIARKADDLTFNMTTAGQAWWQKGPLSVPTQFLSYQVRLLEAMLPEIMGGSKAFTNMEKLRLIGGQFALYGTGGIPMADYIADQYYKNTKEPIDPDTYRMITRGFWDTLFHGLSGVETDFSARAGSGAGWAKTFEKLTDNYQNTSFLETLLGPSGGIGGVLVDSVRDVGNLVTLGIANPEVNITPGILEKIAQNFTVFTDIQRSYLIYSLEKITTNQGDIVETSGNISSTYAILNLMGAKPYSLTQYYELLSENSEAQVDLRNKIKSILTPRVLKGLHSTDLTERQAIMDEVKAWAQVYSDGNPTMYRNLIQSINTQAPMQNAIAPAFEKAFKLYGNTPYMKLKEEQTQQQQGR